MPKFNVTYEIVTQEGAENGDYDEIGFVSENVDLRQAISDVFDTRTSRVDGITAVEYLSNGWLSVHNGMEYETGSHETRALHFPDNVTVSTIDRIVKYISKHYCPVYST